MFTWRSAFIDFITLKWLKRESQPVEVCDKQELKNIWKDTLNRLETSPVLTYETASEITEESRKIALEEARAASIDTSVPISNLAATKTTHDLQAWFGESVATWNPSDAKDVDIKNLKKQGRPSAKWGYKTPG